MINKTEILREGKAKVVYHTDNPDYVWIHFKDDATAFDGAKKAVVRDKGQINSAISIHLLKLMEENSIPTHFISNPTDRDQICHKLDIVPIEVVVRNVAAGSICRRFGLQQGLKLEEPLVEFFYKDDELHDPPMSDVHALAFKWAIQWELEYMKHAALRVNQVMSEFWMQLGVTLVDFKLEFGRTASGQLLLADEITPDGCRLWEYQADGSTRSLDKDVFRKDLGDLTDTYRELFAKVFGRNFES